MSEPFDLMRGWERLVRESGNEWMAQGSAGIVSRQVFMHIPKVLGPLADAVATPENMARVRLKVVLDQSSILALRGVHVHFVEPQTENVPVSLCVTGTDEESQLALEHYSGAVSILRILSVYPIPLVAFARDREISRV